MNIFAHRGLSEKYPENSLSAFRAAIEQGVEGIELDIIMTKDEEFVVSHDIFIKNSEGKTKDLRQLTVSEISVLDLPEKFGGEKIPAQGRRGKFIAEYQRVHGHYFFKQLYHIANLEEGRNLTAGTEIDHVALMDENQDVEQVDVLHQMGRDHD